MEALPLKANEFGIMFVLIKLCKSTNSGKASLVAQLVKNLPAMQETPIQFLGQEDPWRRGGPCNSVFTGFPGGSDGKESACKGGDLGWEDPLELGMATHFNILAWRIPMDKRACWATVHRVTDSRTGLSD